MFPGEDGDRIGEREWAVSDEEVEGSVSIPELVAAQEENLAGREPVDGDQQRCEAGIERDGAIRREDADDVFELFSGGADRRFSTWERRDAEVWCDVSFGGPGEELREPTAVRCCWRTTSSRRTRWSGWVSGRSRRSPSEPTGSTSLADRCRSSRNSASRWWNQGASTQGRSSGFTPSRLPAAPERRRSRGRGRRTRCRRPG